MKNRKMFRTSDMDMRVAQSDGKKVIEGYFIVFNSRTELWNGYFEEIRKESLEGQLDKDIRALFDHDSSKVLARAKNGTLKMEVDDIGLYGVIEINENDSEALNLYERVKRGDIDQCSFGFFIEDSEIQNLENGQVLEIITRMNLVEISVVTFPAYEATSVKARKKDFEEEQRQKEIEEQKQRQQEVNDFKYKLQTKLKEALDK